MFLFGKWNIKLLIKELFVKCGKKIVQISEQKNWIFGYPLMKKYQITLKIDDNTIYFKANNF